MGKVEDTTDSFCDDEDQEEYMQCGCISECMCESYENYDDNDECSHDEHYECYLSLYEEECDDFFPTPILQSPISPKRPICIVGEQCPILYYSTHRLKRTMKKAKDTCE